MEGLGSGCGVEGAAVGAGVCAGACCCPRAGRLKTAISTNIQRPPHCFFKLMLLSNVCVRRSIVASSENLRGGLKKDQRKFWMGAIQTLSVECNMHRSEISIVLIENYGVRAACEAPAARRPCDIMSSPYEAAASTAVIGNAANKRGWRVGSERASCASLL